MIFAAAAATHGGAEGGPAAPPHAVFQVFGLDVFSEVVTAWVIMAVLVVLSALVTRQLALRPRRLQAAVEVVVNFIIDGVVAPSIGGRDKAIRYLPFLGTLFLFIITSNYVGLLPGAVLEIPGYKAPTSALSVTATLAILAFIATHYAGLREKGLRYFGHFFQPFWWLFPMNLIEELVRPLSLSLRLFGNIFGGETILWVLLMLVPWFVPLPIMGLELFFGFLQAFIFTTLTAVYIGGAIAEGHGH